VFSHFDIGQTTGMHIKRQNGHAFAFMQCVARYVNNRTQHAHTNAQYTLSPRRNEGALCNDAVHMFVCLFVCLSSLPRPLTIDVPCFRGLYAMMLSICLSVCSFVCRLCRGRSGSFVCRLCRGRSPLMSHVSAGFMQ